MYSSRSKERQIIVAGLTVADIRGHGPDGKGVKQAWRCGVCLCAGAELDVGHVPQCLRARAGAARFLFWGNGEGGKRETRRGESETALSLCAVGRRRWGGPAASASSGDP